MARGKRSTDFEKKFNLKIQFVMIGLIGLIKFLTLDASQKGRQSKELLQQFLKHKT